MKRFALAVALALLVASISSSPAVAQTTYTDTVTGVELFPGVKIGNVRFGATFAAKATGDLPGAVVASINYTPPDPGPNVTNTVVGGKWALTVIQNGQVVGKVFGAVTGGSAVWNSTGTVAAVTLTLSVTGGTGAFTGATGSGSFSGFLSHLTFPPTFGGTLILTF